MSRKYRAFISYSHRDEPFARWLHARLERWPVSRELAGRETPFGTVPSALRPIFRDRDDFSGGSSLQQATLRALEETDSMVVICSPASAASTYVNEEIRSFRMLGRGDRIFPVIIAGDPASETENCFPVWLRQTPDADGNPLPGLTEPIAADARDIGDGRQRAAAKVAAGILGVPFDEIIRRDERARRKRLAGLAGAGAGAFAFATAFAAYAFYQSYQANLAIDRSVFSIGGILQTTDELPDSEEVGETKRFMLREQCDLMDGLAHGRANIAREASAICFFQRAAADSPDNPAAKKLATLCAWRDRQLQPVRSGKPTADETFAAVYALAHTYDEIDANGSDAPACATGGKNTAPDHLAFLISNLEAIGLKRPDNARLQSIHEKAVWRMIEMKEATNDWAGSTATMRAAATLRASQMAEISTENPHPAAFEYGIYMRRLSWIEKQHLADLPAALKDGLTATTHWTGLHRDNPDNLRIAFQTVLAHEVLGGAQLALRTTGDARKSYQAGINLAEKAIPKIDKNDTAFSKEFEQELNYLKAQLAALPADSP